MRKILLLFLLQFISYHALATDFTVTSNADAGPGTLRQALIDAAQNGSATQDRIIFNIADQSEAGRTITLQSQLPYVSSNLIIDGTTQPGGSLGRSDARITIQPSNSRSVYSPFMLFSVNGFEMYGLYIRDFIGDLPFQGSSAIYVNACKNVQIGAPGKGNVFANNTHPISSTFGNYQNNNLIANSVENLTIYSNFFGFEPDGKSYRGNPPVLNGGIDLSGCAGTVIIGGTNAQRNIFGNMLSSIECQGTIQNNSHAAVINITNNYFNYDIDGQYAPLTAINTNNLRTINIVGAGPYLQNYIMPYTINIIGNKIQDPGVVTIDIKGEIIFHGNQINNEAYPNKQKAVTGWLGFNSEDRILVGGENAGEPNTIYGAIVNLFSRKSILIQRNSIYCTNDTRTWIPGIPYLGAPLNLPVIEIKKINLTSVSGTATPLSKVELFWDDDCQYCQPLTYIATVNADAAGNWQYNGAIQKGVIASSTLNGFTSLFTTAADYQGGTLLHSSCTTGGSITGTIFHNTGGYQWKNQNGNIVGTESEIKNLQPGTYTLSALNGSCSTDRTFKIFDATPKINDQNKHITPPSCTSKGGITGLYLENNDVISDANSRGDYNAYTYAWKSADGSIKSTSIDLTNADAGIYKLEVTYKNQCTQTYGPVTLTNTTGPNIDQSTSTIAPTNCGESKGSITNITATGTGTLKYVWKNAAQAQVGNTKDLLNQPAGNYTLQVTDDTNCGPVYTSAITIPEVNGITIDESAAVLSPVACDANGTGSVKGIKVTGATKYQWFNAANVEVGISADLTTAITGDYRLVASNNTCSKQSQVYSIVKHINNKVYRLTSSITTYATCDLDNGHIEVVMSAANDQPVSYRWANAQGATVGATLNIKNLPVNTYTLYGADEFGCEKQILTTNLMRVPALNVVSTNITADRCGQNKGSIHITRLTGGRPPFIFSWKNSAGATIATTADIDNLSAGTYTLSVTDQTDCGLFTGQYIVDDTPLLLSGPAVTDLQLCSAGEALLTINNVMPGRGYRLYDSANSLSPIGDEQSGKFKVNVTAATSYYVSQYIGTCESSRSEIKIVLGGLSGIKMPNAFSPNGDGINDTWKIPGVESYPAANVQVFTRAGQKVFESTGYAQPFDGRYEGKNLPVGTYFYIINLNSGCGLLSGSITIIR